VTWVVALFWLFKDDKLKMTMIISKKLVDLSGKLALVMDGVKMFSENILF
jgi:hypothetical protein